MRFLYSARTSGGALEKGVEVGGSAEEVAQKLKKRNLVPLSILPERRTKEKGGESFWRGLADVGTIPLRQKSLFFRQLAVLMDAGIPLGSALAQTAGACRYRPLVRKAVGMMKIVDSGQPLSRAVKDCSLAGTLEQTILAVGEETGRLAQSLRRVADLYERRTRLRAKIVSASTYPAIVLAFSAGVVFILFSFVLPRFQLVFQRMNMTLPPATERIFRLGASLPKSLAVGALGLFLCVLAVMGMNRFPSTRMIVGRISLAIPLLGAIRLREGLAQCLRLLSVLLECGVPLLRSLDLCAGAASNAVIAQSMTELRNVAARGGSLGENALSLPLLRSIAAPLISAGEQSGELPQMLGRAADWYEADLEEWIKRLSSLLEPVLILIIGLVAAVVVFAVFAPVLDAVRSLAM